MNDTQLRYFSLAYKEGNYSAAARKAPVSHQGLTKSIKSLERELGVPLFEPDRDTQEPRPTEYADELYDFATAYDTNMRLLKEAFARIDSTRRETVRLECSPGVIGAFGPAFAEQFQAAYPQIDLDYAESRDDLCERGLLDGRWDMAIIIDPPARGCAATTLYRSPMYFWTKRDSGLARIAADRPLCVDDLAGQSVAIPGKGYRCYDQLLCACAGRGVELGEVFQMNEIFQLYGYAMEGRGIGFSNGTLKDLRVFQCDESLVALPVEGLSWGFSIQRLENHVLCESERLLWDWCRTCASALPNNELAKQG